MREAPKRKTSLADVAVVAALEARPDPVGSYRSRGDDYRIPDLVDKALGHLSPRRQPNQLTGGGQGEYAGVRITGLAFGWIGSTTAFGARLPFWVNRQWEV